MLVEKIPFVKKWILRRTDISLSIMREAAGAVKAIAGDCGRRRKLWMAFAPAVGHILSHA